MKMSTKRNARGHNHKMFDFLSSFLIIAVCRVIPLRAFLCQSSFFRQIGQFCLWNINNTLNTSALYVYKCIHICIIVYIILHIYSGKYAYFMTKQNTTAKSIFDFFIIILYVL